MNANQGHHGQQTGAPAASPPGREMFPVFRVLLRRRWQLFGCLLLVSSIAFVATALRQPRYEATARVQVVMDKPQIGNLAGSPATQSGDYFNTQCQLLQSSNVLTLAATKLQAMDRSVDAQNVQVDEQRVRELKESVTVNPVPGSRLIDIVGVSHDGAMAAAIANQVTAAFIEISKKARHAANNRIINQVRDQLDQYETGIQAKEEEINRFRQEHLITGSNTALAAVENRLGVIEQELTQTQMLRLDLQTQRDKLNRMLTKGQGMGEDELTLPEIDTHSDVIALKQSLNQLLQEQVKLDQAYLPGHPALRDIRVRIANLQTRLLDRKQNLMQSLMEDVTERYRETVQQEEALVALLDQQKAVGVQLTEQNQQFQRLNQQLVQMRQFHNEFASQLREFMLQEEMLESPVVVVDAAHMPVKPAGLSKAHQAASILLLGLMFSLVFVFALDRLGNTPGVSGSTVAAGPTFADAAAAWGVPWWMTAPPSVATGTRGAETRTIHPEPQTVNHTTGNQSRASTSGGESADAPKTEPMRFVAEADIENTLGALGDIELGKNSYNDLAFAARCRIVQVDQSSSQAATFREMGTGLLGRFGRTRQALVVTSAGPGEGKSTCACNIALVLAKAGRNVLLVDANAQSPTLHRVFPGGQDSAGLQEVLADRNALSDALRDPDISTLTVLPNPTPATFGNEEAFEELSRLIQEWKADFDWIVFDAESLTSTRCKHLLGAVGRCLCVTGAAASQSRQELAEQIELSGAVCLGMVENAHQATSKPSQQQTQQA